MLNNLGPSEIYGVVDLSSTVPGSYQIKPQTVVPDEITVLQQWPTVSLWVKPELLENNQNSNFEWFPE